MTQSIRLRRVYSRARQRQGRVPAAVYALVGCASLIVLWQAYVWVVRPAEFIVPSPIAVFSRLVHDGGLLSSDALVTGKVVALGYVLSIALGVPIAAAIAYVRLIERLVYPILVVLQVIPKISLAPVFVIWFGFGFEPKLLITFLLCFFPIVVDSVSGFKSISIEVMEFARSTGAGRLRTFRKIRLPTALPFIFTGLKVSATMATTAAVVAEFVAADRGLGYLLLQANGNLDTTLVFADIFVLGAMGFVLYLIIEGLERLLLPWHVDSQLEATASM